MLRVHRLSGIIMSRDQEVVSFEINGENIWFEEITPVEQLEYKPFEFLEGYSKSRVYEFIEWRLPDANRRDLPIECKDAGIEMTGDEILKFSCGRVCDDPCWIKFSDGPQTYRECLKDFRIKSDMLMEKECRRKGLPFNKE